MTGRLYALHRVRGVPSEMSDEALLAACAVGDGPALGGLYDRLQPHVWRFLARMTGAGVEDLDDLVQATFLAAHGAAARYQGGASVRTWLFAIAANVARNHTRGEVRRRAAIVRLAELPPEPVIRPDDSVLRRDLLDRVQAALAQLPHDLRVAFVMCDVEQIGPREASRVLAVPEGTLGRRLHEARKALRAALEGDPGAHEPRRRP
jgi:RNA polymerase sigma-70 factor, ECF subfamily